jgi:hypothetical protein
MPTNIRDPRTIVTPDAFEIAPHLMGTPLAPPWRRFWALMLDLVVILVLTVVLGDIAVLVWGTVGLILVRVAFVRPSASMSQAAAVLLRVFTGCLGLVILAGVGVAMLVFSLATDEGGGVTNPGTGMSSQEGQAPGRAASVLARLGGGIGAVSDLAGAETAEEAEEAALVVLETAAGMGLDEAGLEDLLASVTVEDVPWEADADDIFERALDRWRAGREPGTGVEPDADAEGSVGATEVAAMDDDDALAEYARLLREEGLGEVGDEARVRALRERVRTLVAADTLESLSEEVVDLREDLEDEEARRRRAERALEDAGSPMVALLRDIWEQLGSAIGLWSVYFTVLLTLWKGQTVGKRVMGIRVLRLDGEPMTWWSAFERAGGYIAGVATGLLGFAQVFWDPNRQCIHDKIVGTVVVDIRATPDPRALSEAWDQTSTGTG